MSHHDDEIQEEIIEDLSANSVNVPWIYRWARISHYYGDAVRELLIGAAALMLVTAPFYTDNLSTELPFIVIGTILLVCVAAFTSPWRKSAIRADAVAAGVGLVIFEMWALQGYNLDEIHKFVLREALAVIFLFAFYFSTKTLRAMILHRMGKLDTPFDFSPDKKAETQAQKDHMDWRENAQEALHDINEREKLDFTD